MTSMWAWSKCANTRRIFRRRRGRYPIASETAMRNKGVTQICPLISTCPNALVFAMWKIEPALPLRNRTSPSRSSRRVLSSDTWSRINWQASSSDSKPSSSVTKRNRTSGLYLESVSAMKFQYMDWQQDLRSAYARKCSESFPFYEHVH